MYTIVVADDEEELRRAILRRIPWEEIGFSVVGEAENGIEALELVERLEPDLLLTDIRMPFVSGIELARQVREIRPATQIAFLSGYDDFTYAQQAIQYNIISYLLKPISMAELTESLVQIRKKIDHLFEEFSAKQKSRLDVEGFLLPLLLDGFQTELTQEREKKLERQALDCGFAAGGGFSKHVVLAIALYDEAGGNVTAQDHVHAVSSILKKYVKFNSFYVEGRVVAVVTGTQASLDKYLHILSDDILQSAERILGLHGCLGVSRVTDKLTGLHEAYRESVNALRYANRTAGSVHYIADEEPFGGPDMEYALDVSAQVENLIRGGTREELEAYVGQLFRQAGERISARPKLNFLLMELYLSVCRIFYALSEEGGRLQEDPYMQQMLFLDSPLSEAAAHFTAFCTAVQEKVAEQRKKSSMDICDRALRLIQEQYADPSVSLLSVSSQIGVSPNYLSALVKKKTGNTFVDFLTRKRIEEARKLLLESSMKIREVAERCGYSDQHYFSYCFKKYAGVSPNMLRQSGGGETV